MAAVPAGPLDEAHNMPPRPAPQAAGMRPAIDARAKS